MQTHKSDNAEDTRLMAELVAGDHAALNALINRWQRPLRSFVMRSVLNESDTDDILQETFVRVYKHRSRYRTGSKFSTWLFTIAINLCRNHMEKAKRRKNVPLEEPDHFAEQADDQPAPPESLLANERARAVRDAIHDLPGDQRTAVLLFEYEHLSHADIAEIEDTTPKAIENRLYRARRNLRQSLARWLEKA